MNTMAFILQTICVFLGGVSVGMTRTKTPQVEVARGFKSACVWLFFAAILLIPRFV